MPQVPYSPVPTVDLAGTAIPKQSVNAPIEAFGGATAQATSNLGRTLERVGDEIWNRAVAMQDLKNQTEAKEADSQYVIAAGELHAKYQSQLGKNAVDGYSGHVAALKATREKIREGLSNDAARKLYDSATLGTMSRTIFSGAGHSATENKKWALGASESRVKTLGDAALSAPDDDRGFLQSVEAAKSETIQQGQLMGWDEATVSQRSAEAVSSLWAKRIQGKAKENPATAKRWLDEALKTGALRGEQIAPVTNFVNAQLNTVGSRKIAEDIQTGRDGYYGTTNTPIDRAKVGVAYVETSGGNNYNIRGNRHPKYGYALGKYQVMESNLGPWLKEAGIEAMTSDQFLNSPKAQEQLFEFKFGQYLQKYGNFNDAFSMWFTGVPYAQAVREGRNDSIPGYKGIDVQEYVRRANIGLAKATPLREKLERGKQIALETAPDNAVLPDYVEQRVLSSQSQEDRLRANEKFAIHQTISEGLMGGPDGKVPTTLEELRAQPGMEEAWSAADPSDQRKYLKILAQNSKGDSAWTPQKLQEAARLRGMAASDPAEFLAQDVVSMDLPISEKRILMNQQAKMRANEQADPQVSRAMRILQPMLQPAGLAGKTTQNADQYYQFIGALQDRIKDYVAENKKQPNVDEVNKIGAQLLQKRTTGWWSGQLDPSGYGSTPSFQLTPPPDAAEAIKKQILESGQEPTDQQVQRIYIRALQRQLYSKTPTASEGGMIGGNLAPVTVLPPTSE